MTVTVTPTVSVRGMEGAYKVFAIKPGNPKTADVQNVKTGEVITDVEEANLINIEA